MHVGSASDVQGVSARGAMAAHYPRERSEGLTMRATRTRLVLAVIVAMVVVPSTAGPQSPTLGPSSGETTTLLPDGRWLILGGEAAGRPVATALVWDPNTGAT